MGVTTQDCEGTFWLDNVAFDREVPKARYSVTWKGPSIYLISGLDMLNAVPAQYRQEKDLATMGSHPSAFGTLLSSVPRFLRSYIFAYLGCDRRRLPRPARNQPRETDEGREYFAAWG